MNNDSISKYKSFDFSLNSVWQSYFASLYPTPAHHQIEKLKRKWYKANIDPSFIIDFDDANINQTQSNDTNQRTSQSIPRSNENSALYKIEGFLKLAYLPCLILMSGFIVKIMVAAICIMALIRNYGRPIFSKEYGMKLIPSEFTANLLYLITISVHSSQSSLLFFLPITIHLSSGIVEFASRTNLNQYLQTGKLKQISDTIKINRNLLLIIKNKTEFGILFYLIVAWFIGASSIFQIIIYVQFISVKNKFNNNMQLAIYEIRNDINGSSIPAFLKNILIKAYEGILKVINFI